MKVPVWITSDFICPWCWIGEKRLFDAVRLLPADVEVEVRWLPFELNPEMPAEGMSRADYRADKFGSIERGQAADAKVAAVGQEEGLVFNFDRINRTPNTFLAHRLVHWAQGSENGEAAVSIHGLIEALFAAYFTHARDIGRPEVLIDIAQAAGLDPAAATAALASAEVARDVRALEWEMVRRGVNGVPFFNIWGVGASGAAPVPMLKETFEMAIARRQAQLP